MGARLGAHSASSGRPAFGAEMLRVAREVSERVEAAVRDGNRKALESLYLDLFVVDERTRINTSKGERWFCTESEARAAGWRRAKR